MSRHAEPHPAYLAAPPDRRWKGDTLKALWDYLERTAAAMSPSWAGVILPGGAHVALRQLPDEPRTLMIYRKEPFTTEDGETKWTAEVITFLRHFGALDWEKENDFTRTGGPLCRCTERVRVQDLFNGE